MASAIDYSNWKQEKIDGKVYYMSPSANPKHSRLLGNLYLPFRNYLKGKTCEVFMDNIDIHLDEESNNYVIPDMSILCDPTKFKDNGYHGIPSLIVEVISPTSIERDRYDKYRLYENFGIKEFWLIDYKAETIEQFVLSNGSYQLHKLFSIVSDYDYSNRFTEAEREAYTTIIKPTIFSDLEIDIKEIFESSRS